MEIFVPNFFWKKYSSKIPYLLLTYGLDISPKFHGVLVAEQLYELLMYVFMYVNLSGANFIDFRMNQGNKIAVPRIRARARG